MRARDPDTGEDYEVDPNGQIVLPGGGIEVPWWGSPTPTTPMPGLGTQPRGVAPNVTPYQPYVPNMPALNVQPGMPAQQWEGTYTLGVAGEKRLRDTLEQSTIPQTRAGIDQMLAGVQQNRFQNLMAGTQLRGQQTGGIPRYLPKAPTFKPGGWQQYQGAGAGQAGPATGAPVSEDVAAQAIWTGDQQLQMMYQAEHPDWTPLQAVQDWWSWAPHEGANSLAQYAQMKGYLKGA